MTTLQTPLAVVTAVTASATLAAGKHTPVDATSAAATMTLPTPATVGARLRVEKVDATGNAVTISGTIRGVAGTLVLTSQYQLVELFAESLSSWRVAADHRTAASLAAAFAPAGPRAVLGVPVANRTGVTAGPYRTLNTPGTSRTSHFSGGAIGDLRLVYANWTSTPNTPFGDTDNTNASPLPVRAAIEYPAGTITPVFFNSQRTGSVDNGGTLISDPVGVDIPAGTQFWVRTYVNPATGDSWPQVGNSSGNTEGEGFTTGDLTAAGATTIARSDSYTFRPVAIFGRSSVTRSVAIVGDSIAYGQGDTFPAGTIGTTAGGFIARPLTAAGIAWTSIALPGETGGRFMAAATSHVRRMPLIGGCSSAVCNYGVNDLQVGLSPTPTFAIVAAAQVAVWRALALRGIKPWQTTITPFTTSTDSWATTGNQTIDSTTRNNTVRVALNQWLRAGAPLNPSTLAPVAVGTSGALIAGTPSHPLAGVFDVASTVETATDSGIWKATGSANGYTADGLHPSSTAHQAMAAAIDVTKLV